MNLAPTFLELRKQPRAQLRLPARVRWRGPLGMRMESSHTLDVSRNGIRVQRNEPCETGSRVWVVFPFDASSAAGVPPETPARVVRVEAGRGAGYQVTLQLELPARVASRPTDRERRACSRISFALPIFVRAIGFPWPEESMTQNISRTGARFESVHIYSAATPSSPKFPGTLGRAPAKFPCASCASKTPRRRQAWLRCPIPWQERAQSSPASPSAGMSREKPDAPTVVLRRRKLSVTLVRWQISWPKHSIAISLSQGPPGGSRLCSGRCPSPIRRSSPWCATRIRSSAAPCTIKLCIKRPKRCNFATFQSYASTFVARDKARESTIAALANKTTSAPHSITSQGNFRSAGFCLQALASVLWWDCVWAAPTGAFRT
jgi:hypothetical protein